MMKFIYFIFNFGLLESTKMDIKFPTDNYFEFPMLLMESTDFASGYLTICMLDNNINNVPSINLHLQNFTSNNRNNS